MEICEFNGNFICAYDVTNINYALNYEVKKAWKIAGKNGELKCVECGNEVILRINDPRKMVPHFSHRINEYKCDFSNNYLKESENHKKGKMMLYYYFKGLYPTEQPIINYRFENKRRADLYIEFNNGNRLVVEYQRTNLDIIGWQERQDNYDRLNIKTIWVLQGEEEKLKIKDKQIEVPFFQQIMLNELEKIALFLDVEKSKFIFAKNMIYIDKYNSKNVFDEMFIMAYNIEEVVITSDGTIECDFISKYNKEKVKFINTCTKICELKEKECNDIESQTSTEIINIRYCEGGLYYSRKIKGSIQGNYIDKNYLINYIAKQAGADDYKNITLMFKYIYLKGNKQAALMYSEIMNNADFEVEEFNTSETINELKCPYCKGNLNEKYGKYGAFVSCSNYPKCRFGFDV